jgi:hypothetical protein
LPPRTAPVPRSVSQPHRKIKSVPPDQRTVFIQNVAIGFFSFYLLLESARLTIFNPKAWENKLMVVPAWRMFADGGVSSGGKWRLFLETPQGEVDGTALSLQTLPHIWRDRFYIDAVFHELLNKNTGSGSLVQSLIQGSEKIYRDRQLQSHGNPVILNTAFEIYR